MDVMRLSALNHTNSHLLCNTTTTPLDQGEFSYVFAFLFGIPASLIILITIVGNFLVLCFKARVGKRQTTLLIWNLGLADFLVGVIVLPIGVITVIVRKWIFGRLICRVWVACDVIFCTASIVTLCIISVDRYIGVTRPLRYKLIVTKSKVVAAIVSIWIFSISILMATVKWRPEPCVRSDICHVGNELEYVVHSVIFAFFIPATVTLILYWKIFKVAKAREKCLADGLVIAISDNFLKGFVAAPLRIHRGTSDAVNQQQTIIRMHKKVAKTLGVVVSAFLFCWLPFFSLYLFGHNCGNCIPGQVLDITTWLGYCNSMINPVIYAFTIGEFRENLKTILRPLSYFQLLCPQKYKQRNDSLQQLPRSGRAYSLNPDGEIVPQKTASKNQLHPTTVMPGRSSSSGNLRTYAGLSTVDEETEIGGEEPDNSPHMTAVEELVWSAKLYCTLISPKATKM